jgi:tight adherence protein B
MTTSLLIGGGVLALVLLVVGLVVSATSDRTSMDDRLNKYLEEEKSTDTKDSKGALTDWVNKRVEKSSFGDRISRELARADLKFKPGEYMAGR